MRVLRRKEVALVRRIFVMVALALVVAVMMAVAAPAFAAIHQLARMECANGSSEVVQEQDPPGLEGQSNADNEMQSTRSVSKNDTAASHAFKPEDCPAPNKNK
jgi:MFS superfamily sulfate permease-like transporter